MQFPYGPFRGKPISTEKGNENYFSNTKKGRNLVTICYENHAYFMQNSKQQASEEVPAKSMKV